MTLLADIERNVAWIERQMRRRPAPARARELLARLKFEQRALERLTADHGPLTSSP